MIQQSVLKISGVDAQHFLQNQLSNDIEKTSKTMQLNAYCQHQGRVIATLWVIKDAQDFYLIMADDLREVVLKRLQMFALNAAVMIEKSHQDFQTPSYPSVCLASSEKFIIQDLNLDINEVGVSFTKGCYPGQEVVARVHYLGKPKKRLYQFECDFEPEPLDELHLENLSKPIGWVVDRTKSGFFAVLKVSEVTSNIFINNQPVKLLQLSEYKH
jgi:folate-binding protein YgfZ